MREIGSFPVGIKKKWRRERPSEHCARARSPSKKKEEEKKTPRDSSIGARRRRITTKRAKNVVFTFCALSTFSNFDMMYACPSLLFVRVFWRSISPLR